MPEKLTLEQFIEKAKDAHGDTYDYRLSVYRTALSKVEILCPKHGSFMQTPAKHMAGQGCPECKKSKISASRKSSGPKFIERAQHLHGNRYDYHLVRYLGSKDFVQIICAEHGAFAQTPEKHLEGQGCPRCGRSRIAASLALTQEEWIDAARKVHGDLFDYGFVKYRRGKEKVTIYCREHGPFDQEAISHLRGHGCPKCADRYTSGRLSMTRDQFIERAREQHGDGRYLYEYVQYRNANIPVQIACKYHGPFMQTPWNHLLGFGCKKCSNSGPSKGETEVFEFVRAICPDAHQSNRKLIFPRELDIVIPSRSIAIEFNGTYWHSDKFGEKDDHAKKHRRCAELGYRLIHLTDVEWATRRPQMERLIRHALGENDLPRLNARDCTVQEVAPKSARDFLNEWHPQGAQTNGGGEHRLGLFHPEHGLVALMCFGLGTNSRGSAAKDRPWTLARFASAAMVRGGASKLFKAAHRKIGFDRCISFSMNDWFGGGLYEKLGFARAEDIATDYRVYHPKSGLRPKSHWQRRLIPTRLAEIGRQDIEFNPDKSVDPRTEWEIEDLVGALRIWDSGKIRWEWKI